MNHVLLMLEKSAKQVPNKIAVIEEEKSCTYLQLQRSSKAVASYLIKVLWHYTLSLEVPMHKTFILC